MISVIFLQRKIDGTLKRMEVNTPHIPRVKDGVFIKGMRGSVQEIEWSYDDDEITVEILISGVYDGE